MRPRHERQTVIMIKCLADVLSKGIPCTPWTDAPSTPIIRITPQQVAHRALMWHLLNSVERFDVVKRVNGWAQASMQTEDLVLDECGERKVVEEVGEVFPDVGIAVFAQALIIEAVHLCDLARLVVSAEDGDAGGVADLESDKERDRLYREITSIDIVTCTLFSHA